VVVPVVMLVVVSIVTTRTRAISAREPTSRTGNAAVVLVIIM